MDSEERQRKMFGEDLERLGFTDPMLEYYFDTARNEPSVKAPWFRAFGEDNTKYSLCFSLDEQGVPYLSSYWATLIRTGPIPHKVIAKSDTRALEERMGMVDWHGPESREALAGIFMELENLRQSAEPTAAEIAERLMVRYWENTWVAHHIKLEQLSAKFERSHLFQVTGRTEDITALQAHNLLCGRPVILFGSERPGLFEPYWQSLSPNKTEPGKFNEIWYPPFDLGMALKRLPIMENRSERESHMILRSLFGGDPVNLTVSDGRGSTVTISLTVLPLKKSIGVYDTSGNEIGHEKMQAMIQTVPGNANQLKNIKGKRLKN